MTKDSQARPRSKKGPLRLIVRAALIGVAVGCAAGFKLVAPGDTIPTTDPAQCTHPHPAGLCPWCGLCVWQDNTCTFRGRRNIATCRCYEGQTQTCLIAAPGTACTPGTAGCGSKSCVATDSTHASWGACH